jgi:hypothetical protein
MDTRASEVDRRNVVLRLLTLRASRHVALATALLVVVYAVVGLVCLHSFRTASAEIDGLDARATGQLERVGWHGDPRSVEVRWQLPDGRTAHATVTLTVSPPRPGTKVLIAYDPELPRRAVIPRAAVFDTLDRSATGMGVVATLIALVLLFELAVLITGVLLLRRRARALAVRRIRLQRGLSTRSWLETADAPERWIPVHFDPVLVTLPTPVRVRVYGDPWRNRLVAIEAPASDAEASTSDDALLLPSGLVRAGHPRGRRADNPTEPDAEAPAHAAVVTRMSRQLRADASRLVIAPLVGVFWAILDDGGLLSWLAATAMVTAFSLWVAAIRGSDPS